MSGRFIVLEGLDGAGTTTQLARLAQALRARGRTVHTTAEPSTGPVGQQLREALARKLTLPDGALALLFAADRLHHLASEIEPRLAAGEWVLCDRYVLSSLAYQGATLPVEWVGALNARARAADLTLFLEVDVATAARRRAARGGEEELFDSKQAAIAQRYREAVASHGAAQRVVVVDGERPAEEVTAAALKAILSDVR